MKLLVNRAAPPVEGQRRRVTGKNTEQCAALQASNATMFLTGRIIIARRQSGRQRVLLNFTKQNKIKAKGGVNPPFYVATGLFTA